MNTNNETETLGSLIDDLDKIVKSMTAKIENLEFTIRARDTELGNLTNQNSDLIKSKKQLQFTIRLQDSELKSLISKNRYLRSTRELMKGPGDEQK